MKGSVAVSFSKNGVSHGQGGSSTWVDIVKAGNNASDIRLKTNISEFENIYDRIFDRLKPVQFQYTKKCLGDGIHFGYIAQDVIEAFESEGQDIKDYSLMYEHIAEDDGTDKYYHLTKQEFIALNTWQIQKLKARVAELEAKLDSVI